MNNEFKGYSRKCSWSNLEYCHDLGMLRVTYRRGLLWMIGFTDTLYTQFGTTDNYSSIADLHFTVHRYTRNRISQSSLVVSWQRNS
jgi:hypothetical protein